MEAGNLCVNEQASTSSTLMAISEATRQWLDVADATSDARRACARVESINDDVRALHDLADRLWADG